MAQILVRGLDDNVVKALKAEARSHHRSLEAQVRSILASWLQMGDFRHYVKKAASRKDTPESEATSTQIIRKSRDAR
jgi:plasmid stability protein